MYLFRGVRPLPNELAGTKWKLLMGEFEMQKAHKAELFRNFSSSAMQLQSAKSGAKLN